MFLAVFRCLACSVCQVSSETVQFIREIFVRAIADECFLPLSVITLSVASCSLSLPTTPHPPTPGEHTHTPTACSPLPPANYPGTIGGNSNTTKSTVRDVQPFSFSSINAFTYLPFCSSPCLLLSQDHSNGSEDDRAGGFVWVIDGYAPQ